MRFKTETMEVERRGDGVDEPDLFDSLSARARRRANRQPHRYRGISEWCERRQDTRQTNSTERHSPPAYKSPPYQADHVRRAYPTPDYPATDYLPQQYSPASDFRRHRSPSPDYRQQQHSPIPNYRRQSPVPDYGRPPTRMSPPKRDVTPTPPARKRSERQRQRVVEERSRYQNGYRNNRTDETKEQTRIEEPPPDYSPPSPPPMPTEKKQTQKTRFSIDNTPTKPQKTGNIIGQSIRKLVGKIRSASAERKARRANKRSPSPPTYQPGHVIDSNISGSGSMEGRQQSTPVQRYYLGEDPFAGSIYGRENKYDGVRPVRTSRRPKEIQEERRSQSTLGRFSKSTSRLANTSAEVERATQTLPRHLNRQSPPTRLGNRSNSTINVSIINTVSTPTKLQGPAKPARTYRSNLSRSKSLNVHGGLDPNRPNMHTSNPHLNKLEESPIGLKSPGLISSLNRSQRDVTSEDVYTTRFARNGTSDNVDNKRVFLSGLKDRAPELFKTLEESDREWKPSVYSSPIRNGKPFNGDIYEPPTRLKDTMAQNRSQLRRGSASSTDFSETYHTTTRNDDPVRPSVTNTTRSFTKKTIPSKDGRSVETIQSSETKSVTKSHYRGNEPGKNYFEERRYNNSSAKPVVIEVRNYRK